MDCILEHNDDRHWRSVIETVDAQLGVDIQPRTYAYRVINGFRMTFNHNANVSTTTSPCKARLRWKLFRNALTRFTILGLAYWPSKQKKRTTKTHQGRIFEQVLVNIRPAVPTGCFVQGTLELGTVSFLLFRRLPCVTAISATQSLLWQAPSTAVQCKVLRRAKVRSRSDARFERRS